MLSTLHTDLTGKVAVVTIDRPAKRNAVDLAMWEAMPEIFADLARRPEVHAVVVTGAAGQFSAGADISEFRDKRATPKDSARYEEIAESAIRSILNMPKPTIAAVHGYAVGGGCNIALACDIRVGDATTEMGIPAARLGITYGVLGTRLLYRQIGLSAAKLVLFSGRLFRSEECLRMKLLDLAAPDALVEAKGLAEGLAELSPTSQRNAKSILETLSRENEEQAPKELDDLIRASLVSSEMTDRLKARMKPLKA